MQTEELFFSLCQHQWSKCYRLKPGNRLATPFCVSVACCPVIKPNSFLISKGKIEEILDTGLHVNTAKWEDDCVFFFFFFLITSHTWLFFTCLRDPQSISMETCSKSFQMAALARVCLCQACVCLKQRETDPPLCLLSAGNDVKDVFASARSGDQYRVLKIVIEDGERCPFKLPPTLWLRPTLECQHG